MLRKLWMGAGMALAMLSAEPQRYIVELRGKSDLTPIAEYVEKHKGKVLTRMENAIFALVVDMDEETSAAVQKLPGVKSVRKNRNVMKRKVQE